MSTLWLARRVGRLVSFEADAGWHAQLARFLSERCLTHVELHHRWVATDLSDFSLVADASLDLCVIDGGPRLACLLAALPKLRPGGCIYADNTDSNPGVKDRLQKLADERGWPLTFHRGFPPACLYLSEGAVLERPRTA